jgi:hypothetical protein
MTARLLRPTDLVALTAFRKEAPRAELTARQWPLVEPESSALPVLRLALTQEGWYSGVWVSGDLLGLGAVGTARPRSSSGLAWDADRLFALEGEEDAAVEILEHLVETAGQKGALRVFVSTADIRGQEVARKGGFQRYASATYWLLPPGRRSAESDSLEARGRRRSDEQRLFQLYSAAVPAPVRAAEAMTIDEWKGLQTGRRRGRRSFLWELGANVVATAEVLRGRRSQYLDLIVHPKYEESVDRLLRYALQQVNADAPVYVRTREDQVILASALERAGFRPIGDIDLQVRLLAARVAQPAFAAANLVSS